MFKINQKPNELFPTRKMLTSNLKCKFNKRRKAPRKHGDYINGFVNALK